MHWTQDHNHWLSQSITKNLKESKYVNLLKDEGLIEREVFAILNQDFDKEKELEKEVVKTLDELEATHGGSFNRQKMYSLLKRKLAEKKGIVL